MEKIISRAGRWVSKPIQNIVVKNENVPPTKAQKWPISQGSKSSG